MIYIYTYNIHNIYIYIHQSVFYFYRDCYTLFSDYSFLLNTTIPQNQNCSILGPWFPRCRGVTEWPGITLVDDFIIPRTSKRKEHLPSGKLTKRLTMAIEIVNLPIKYGDFVLVMLTLTRWYLGNSWGSARNSEGIHCASKTCRNEDLFGRLNFREVPSVTWAMSGSSGASSAVQSRRGWGSLISVAAENSPRNGVTASKIDELNGWFLVGGLEHEFYLSIYWE